MHKLLKFMRDFLVRRGANFTKFHITNVIMLLCMNEYGSDYVMTDKTRVKI